MDYVGRGLFYNTNCTQFMLASSWISLGMCLRHEMQLPLRISVLAELKTLITQRSWLYWTDAVMNYASMWGSSSYSTSFTSSVLFF